ncbi:hypothetical protein [Stygiolobus caldivivus]|uniref:Uncharacterized protein n=1 Tax=Stygiolobus caldivivus TaxID=2824673 RepID=A0A8D5U810_9CREN|nr:hypothetical protein [Stygiolobus caldivivus]BCU71059.1 hypothetical protein KN1_23560 [Stygiolobus caldivivus]
MPIRDEITYARMSFNDFLVSYERLENGLLKLSAFRAYKAERRLLQSLAMHHGFHRKDTKCAVPKKEMLEVALKLENVYKGIYLMTKEALELFEQYKTGNVEKSKIVSLLLSLNYDWLLGNLTKEQIEKIRKLQLKLRGEHVN